MRLWGLSVHDAGLPGANGGIVAIEKIAFAVADSCVPVGEFDLVGGGSVSRVSCDAAGRRVSHITVAYVDR